MNQKDTFTLGGKEFSSRFILGSGKFSLDLVKACVEKAGAQIITLALRRANEGGLANILDYIPAMADVQMYIPIPMLFSRTYVKYTESHTSCKQTELLLTESDIPLLTDLFPAK